MINLNFDDWLNNSKEPLGPKEPEKFWFLCSNNKESAIIHAAYHEDSIKMWSEGGKWTSRSGSGLKTREELIDRNKIFEDCAECHTDYFSVHWTKDINEALVKEHICFNCNFWREKIPIKDNPSCFRIQGEHYQLGGEGGFGGREFSIKRFDSEKIITTKCLWSQGTIPEHFRDRLPDNAEFVKTPEAIGHGQGYLQKW
jgi:hypothetical protein